jgi:RNA recognition motif-containing protein
VKRIYVGNLSLATTEEHLAHLFGKFGAVSKAGLLRDSETGKPRGFGFVLMKNDQEGDAAIQGLNYMRVDGSVILVRDAMPSPTPTDSARRNQ